MHRHPSSAQGPASHRLRRRCPPPSLTVPTALAAAAIAPQYTRPLSPSSFAFTAHQQPTVTRTMRICQNNRTAASAHEFVLRRGCAVTLITAVVLSCSAVYDDSF
ncbi:hypothetical protein R3P38DRAFT_3231024 [Favolaschia claudopus]|uniref:Uncharacterized protein n=1 Tax=Favolaschia claudopus TaxID=2862362 RepID=A0AAV9ZLD2_9AGAR